MGADVAAARVEPREWMAKAAWARRAAPWALVSCGLSLATYTTTGYQYQVWPQFFLQYVLRYSGRLSNDWATQFPSPHWAVSHGLAWVPGSWLASVVFVLWALGLIGLWLAFAAVCRLLGLTWPGVIGAGLVAVSTGFAGLGLSRPVTGFLYPTNLSFVFIVLAVVALLEERAVLLGLALGLAILLHPDMGVLGALAILPAYLLTGPIRAYRRHAALAVALLVPASPALYEALANLVLKSSLSSHRRYELLAEVRAPWHFLYRAFPAAEWAMVGGWLVVFVVAVRLLPQDRSRRALTIVVVASGVVCALGAAASQWGQPLFLVQLQTARLTSLMILVAIVVAFSALHSAVGRWTGVIGAMVFLVAPVFQTALLGIHHLPGRIASALSPSSLEAGTLFVLVLAFAWAARSAPAVVGRSRPATAALACSLAAVAITLIPAFQTEWTQRRHKHRRTGSRWPRKRGRSLDPATSSSSHRTRISSLSGRTARSW